MAEGGCLHGGAPKWLEKVAFIKHYTMNVCETPWRIYLETGGHALGNLAMTMLYIDTGDLVRSFFRPKGTRSRYHSIPLLGRGKRRIAKGIFPEPSDVIADTVRSATDLKKPVYSDGFKHIWTIDNHLQRVANHVVIVNMVTDFAYDWFSGILLQPDSKCNEGRFSCFYENGDWDEGGFRPMSRFGDPRFEFKASCDEHWIDLEAGTWAITWYSQLGILSGVTGSTVSYFLFVGKDPHLKVCGRPLNLTQPATGIDEGEMWSVVEGPVRIRVMGISPGVDGGFTLGPPNPVWIRGFQMY